MAVRRLGPGDEPFARQMNALFADAFDMPDAYAPVQGDEAQIGTLLANPDAIALIHQDGDELHGALTAYLLRKFEGCATEIYMYDLAVAKAHRRKGIATELIEELCKMSQTLGARAVFVQADAGDDPALALYRKLGREERVHHFDLLDPDNA